MAIYSLYRQVLDNLQQVVADSDNQISQQVAAKLFSSALGSSYAVDR